MTETRLQPVEEIEISDDVCEVHSDYSDQEWISSLLNHPVFEERKSPDVICMGETLTTERQQKARSTLESDITSEIASELEQTVVLNNDDDEIPNEGRAFYGIDEMKNVVGESYINGLDTEKPDNFFVFHNDSMEEEPLNDLRTNMSGLHEYAEEENNHPQIIAIDETLNEMNNHSITQSELPSTLVLAPVFKEKASTPTQSTPSEIAMVSTSSNTTSHEPDAAEHTASKKLAAYEWFTHEFKALQAELERRLATIDSSPAETRMKAKPSIPAPSSVIKSREPDSEHSLLQAVTRVPPKRPVCSSIIPTSENRLNIRRDTGRAGCRKMTPLKTSMEVTQWIKATPSVYEDILLFNAVDIDVTKARMLSSGHTITKKYLREYFGSHSVNYYDAAHENANRRGAGHF